MSTIVFRPPLSIIWQRAHKKSQPGFPPTGPDSATVAAVQHGRLLVLLFAIVAFVPLIVVVDDPAVQRSLLVGLRLLPLITLLLPIIGPLLIVLLVVVAVTLLPIIGPLLLLVAILGPLIGLRLRLRLPGRSLLIR